MIPLRIGFDRARARDQQWLFTNRKLPARPQRHVMDGLFEFAELIGVQRPAAPRWDIPIGPADFAAVAPLFKKGSRTLVISPCTGQRFRNYRNWRSDWYAQVADYAAQRYGAYVLVTGGNTETEQTYGREIAATARFQASAAPAASPAFCSASPRWSSTTPSGSGAAAATFSSATASG